MKPPEKTETNRLGRVLLERDVESYFKDECKKAGWVAEKFSSPQKRSVPDQMVTCPDNFFFPFGFTFFAEMKRPWGVATASQREDHTRRRDMGQIVFVLDCYEKCDQALDIIEELLNTGTKPDIPIWLLL